MYIFFILTGMITYIISIFRIALIGQKWDAYSWVFITEYGLFIVYRGQDVMLSMFAFQTVSSNTVWHQCSKLVQLMSAAKTCLLQLCTRAFSCTLPDTMKYPACDKGVNSNSTGWPFCCGVIHLWLRGLVNGCRPCSMFSIGSIQHRSTPWCI